MKIKKEYYCLVDSNNKPDFRFIFTNKEDANKKRIQIKNSLTGETLFVSKYKRDFFIDGIKRDFIGKKKPINIKKGCWTRMRTSKISILDTIQPETYFKEIVKKNKKEYSTYPIVDYKHFNTPTKTAKSNLHQKNNSTKVIQPVETISKKTASQKKEFSSTYFRKQNIKKGSFTEKVPNNNDDNDNSLLSKILNFRISRALKFPRYYSPLKTKLFVTNFVIIVLICSATIFYANTSSNKKIAMELSKKQHQLVENQEKTPKKEITVLGSMDIKNDKVKNQDADIDNIDAMVFDTLMKFEKIRKDQLEESIKKMVAGTPMEKMAPYIAKKDKIVAAFLVGIAKKESNYGRRVPVLNGQDCFNYWGYRSKRTRMGTGGHTCFDSPEDAVETVGGRIERLVKSGVDTPEEMVLWKCGSDCNSTGGWSAAQKWISDVNMYYTKMLGIANADEKSSEKIKVLNETVNL